MSNQRQYVRMSTVFPVEFEVFRDDGPHGSSGILQGYTRDVSAGGMCIELKSFGKDAENLFHPNAPLELTIHTTFAKNPVKAAARIAWLMREDTRPVAYRLGVAYTRIDEKAQRRILKHAQRLIWFPRATAVFVAGLAIALAFSTFYVQRIAGENRRLVRQMTDAAAERSHVAVKLDELERRRSSLEKELLKARTKIKAQEASLGTLARENVEAKRAAQKKLRAAMADEKAVDRELESIRQGQEKLKAAYASLNETSRQSAGEALRQMYAWLKTHRNLRTGLVTSYEGDPGLEDWAFTYDQSLAAMAFAAFGDTGPAANVLEFYRSRAQTDHGGYFNAYDAVDGSPKENVVRVGPNVWIGLAALQYEKKTGDGRFLPMAVRLGDWLAGLQDAEGGVKGGPGVSWYSTEHNLDAYAFFEMLEALTGDKRFGDAKRRTLGWIKKYAYTAKERRMQRGKGDATIATDTFSWAVAAIGPKTLLEIGLDPEEIMAYAEEHCAVAVKYTLPSGKADTVRGFDFAKASNVGRGGVISTEWTAQVIVTYRILSEYFRSAGDEARGAKYAEKAEFYRNELQKLFITSPSRTGQGRGCLPYASTDNVDTGHGWRTPKGKRTGSVAGTAYGVFAWLGYNPFRLENPSAAEAGA